jgi:glucose 1-dehydrogenase
MGSLNPLHGLVALVTGASSGIGAGVAKELARARAQVAVNHPGTTEQAEKVVEEIRAEGGKAIALQADVSSEEQVKKMYADLFSEYGTIDILVANAGLQRDSSLVDMTLAQWQFVLNVNLTGQFLCAREAAREFIRRGIDPQRSFAAGKIICMSSVQEVIPWAGHCNYAASKGGVMLMMKSMAQELAPHRIRVNSIGPGAIKTPINRSAWETPQAEAELLKLIPYERVGEPGTLCGQRCGSPPMSQTTSPVPRCLWMVE